jgi:hypothetical protein
MLDLTERNTVTFIICIIFLHIQRNINFKKFKRFEVIFHEKQFFLELISTSLLAEKRIGYLRSTFYFLVKILLVMPVEETNRHVFLIP